MTEQFTGRGQIFQSIGKSLVDSEKNGIGGHVRIYVLGNEKDLVKQRRERRLSAILQSLESVRNILPIRVGEGKRNLLTVVLDTAIGLKLRGELIFVGKHLVKSRKALMMIAGFSFSK